MSIKNGSRATIAEYFRLAIQTDTFPAAVACRWADEIVASEPHPTGDIIEVAWSRKTSEVVAALNGVEGDRDFRLAVCWFFRTLHSQLSAGREPADVVLAARHALYTSELGDEVYYAASSLEDELQHAHMGVHGSPSEVVERISQFLAGHAAESLPAEIEVAQQKAS